MTMSDKPRQNMFSGPVIDGPFEGAWIDCEVSYYSAPAMIFKRLTTEERLQRFSPMQVRVFTYIWLNSYRAWAWHQEIK